MEWIRAADSADGLYATRVAGDGTVLDPGILLASAGRWPSLASNGHDYLVAWATEEHDRDIHALRLRKGRVLDRAPIVVSSAEDRQVEPEVASDGKDFFVAWGDERSGAWDVYGARVMKNGRGVDPAGVLIFGGPEWEYMAG